MSTDEFGERMKLYEGTEAQRRFLPLLPVCVRLDGRNFSSFTRGLRRPYDNRLSNMMITLTQQLVEETNACVGYTQSDEITLVLYSDSFDSQIYFDGRIQKIVSVLAAVATARFNRMLPDYLPEKANELPVFDCRAWTVPNLIEATNAILWREHDATKNSISMAARAFYSHKQLDGLNGKEMQELLFQKGVNWNDYQDFFKRGTYVLRKTVTSKLAPEEIETLPPKHNARLNPDLEITRSKIEVVPLPPLARVHNRVDVLFHGAAPEVGEVVTEATPS